VWSCNLAGFPSVGADSYDSTVPAINDDKNSLRKRVIPLRRQIFYQRSCALERQAAFAEADEILKLDYVLVGEDDVDARSPCSMLRFDDPLFDPPRERPVGNAMPRRKGL